MALERGLTLAGAEDVNKPPRLPRWTRQELLVLIQGKRVAENRVRRGRTAVLSFGSSAQVEPKWSTVSSYCKRHGVNRGPVQCRKRWSNLAGDFKKIKEWESQIKDDTDSFWVMRNDLRRDKKLPGFFDKEVYDILDGGGDKSLVLSLAPSEEAVFDSGRADDGGLFSDDKDTQPPTAPTPISATPQYEPFSQAQGEHEEEAPADSIPPETEADEGRKKNKRKRSIGEEEEEEDEEEISLISAMERNGRLLSSQLEIQNTNSQLDREQRKDHATALFAVLNKIADAMVRIADKL